MEELKNQANELINGNINSYPALSREAAGNTILMLIEKVEKLEEQLRLTQVDNNLLITENTCYQKSLDFYKFKFNNLIEDPKILNLIEIHEERLSYVNDSNITPDELRSILKYALILNIKNARYREALEYYANRMGMGGTAREALKENND